VTPVSSKTSCSADAGGVSPRTILPPGRFHSTPSASQYATARIGPWSDKLDQLLVANEGKAPRERLTLIRVFEELRCCGYVGGYDAVQGYFTGAKSVRPGSLSHVSFFEWHGVRRYYEKLEYSAGVTAEIEALFDHFIRVDGKRQRRRFPTPAR